MVETPLFKVARLLGGVALMQGRFGHQMLGQLMIAGTNELAVAGAAVVVAGSIQQRNTAVQVALRTAAPAIALFALFERREQILLRHERSLQPREKVLAAHDFELETQYGVMARNNAKLSQEKADFQAKNADLEKKTTDLEHEKTRLEGLLEDCQLQRSNEKISNERMRKVLAGVNASLRAYETAASPDTSVEPPVGEAAPAPKKRAKRRLQQPGAKKRDKKREP